MPWSAAEPMGSGPQGPGGSGDRPTMQPHAQGALLFAGNVMCVATQERFVVRRRQRRQTEEPPYKRIGRDGQGGKKGERGEEKQWNSERHAWSHQAPQLTAPAEAASLVTSRRPQDPSRDTFPDVPDHRGSGLRHNGYNIDYSYAMLLLEPAGRNKWRQ